MRTLFSFPRRTRRRGNMVPLVALAIAGGIGGFLLINTVSFGDDTRADAKVDEYYNEVMHVANGIREKYPYDKTQFGSVSDSDARLVSLKLVPSQYASGGRAVTPWGGALTVGGLDRTMFYVNIRVASTIPTVPQTACAQTIIRLAQLSTSTGFNSATTGWVTASSMTQATATAQCGEAWVNVHMN